MEFHTHAKKQLGDHIEGVCEAFQAAWGVDRWFYVDTIWLHGDSGSPAVIADVYDQADECDLKAVPVIRTSYDDATLEQLRAVVEASDRGCLLRITQEVLNTPALIDAVLEAVGSTPKHCDLLLDYRNHPMSLEHDVARIPHLSTWRDLIAASGVFPRTLSHLPLHKWRTIGREDWLSWQQQVSAELERDPVYSDYTVRPPGAPAEFGEPSVNLRYTETELWSVQIGGKVKDGASPEMHGLCQQMLARSEYCGADFSSGDEEISRVADDSEGPGGSTQWVQWCVNHHIEFVLSQLPPVEA